VDDAPLEFAFDDQPFRVAVAGGNDDPVETKRSVPLPLPVVIPKDVQGDFRQPCSETRPAVETGQLGQSPAEGFLRQIVGRGRILRQLMQEIKKIPPLPFNKLVYGFPIARLGLPDQAGVAFHPPGGRRAFRLCGSGGKRSSAAVIHRFSSGIR